MVRDDLGNRMKEYYENIAKTKLMRREPVALRIDGKVFHSLTRGFQKPFDRLLMRSMQSTMKYLCENIQGCVFGYTQSDEITLILVDYKNLNSSAWFDYEVQKMCSVSASMATMAFNKFFSKEFDKWGYKTFGPDWFEGGTNDPEIANSQEWKQMETYSKAIDKGAMFDARCFNIPKEEVCNLVYWRQLDATRNSIQMVARANFSHRELINKSCAQIQDMLMLQKGINWNDFPTDCKRGSACIYDEWNEEPAADGTCHKGWRIDRDMPVLKGEDRHYVEKYIFI